MPAWAVQSKPTGCPLPVIRHLPSDIWHIGFEFDEFVTNAVRRALALLVVGNCFAPPYPRYSPCSDMPNSGTTYTGSILSNIIAHRLFTKGWWEGYQGTKKTRSTSVLCLAIESSNLLREGGGKQHLETQFNGASDSDARKSTLWLGCPLTTRPSSLQ